MHSSHTYTHAYMYACQNYCKQYTYLISPCTHTSVVDRINQTQDQIETWHSAKTSWSSQCNCQISQCSTCLPNLAASVVLESQSLSDELLAQAEWLKLTGSHVLQTNAQMYATVAAACPEQLGATFVQLPNLSVNLRLHSGTPAQAARQFHSVQQGQNSKSGCA